MKLRAVVLLLVLANLGFFAWTRGALDGWIGPPPHGDREPERLARQFQPQNVRIVPPDGAASGSGSGAANSTACLEAGPFSASDVALAEAVLQQALPAGGWSRRSIDQPGVWLVYVGRFATAEAMQKKADELRRLQAPFDEVQSPAELAPGLSIGRFNSQGEAEQALQQWVQRGLRTARVVTLAEPASDLVLRFDRADASLVAQVAALSGDINGQPLGKAFVACKE